MADRIADPNAQDQPTARPLKSSTTKRRVDTLGTERSTRRNRLLIIGGHVLFADLLRLGLEACGMSILPIVSTGEDALVAVDREMPSLILVETDLAQGDGLSAGRMILDRHPQAKVIALSDTGDARAARNAIEAGFDGYLTTDMPLDGLVSALRAVLDGHVVIPRALASSASGGKRSEDGHLHLIVDQLTAREREVLAMLVEGASSQEIARRLFVSLHTVRSHVQSVLTKLQVHSRLEAVAFAVQHEIIESQTA